MREVKILINTNGTQAEAIGEVNTTNLELIGLYDLLSKDEFNKKRKVSQAVLWVKFIGNGYKIQQTTKKGELVLADIYSSLKNDLIDKVKPKFIRRTKTNGK